MADETRLYTVEEVAEQLRCTPQHVYNLMKAGKLRSLKLGRSRRIRHEDLVAMITQAAEDAA